MNKPHEERFPPRVWVEVKQRQFTKNTKGSVPIASFSAGVNRKEYLSLAEHQHILAEKEKRVERLREQLKLSAIRMGILTGRMRACHADTGKHELIGEAEALCEETRAALQEETK